MKIFKKISVYLTFSAILLLFVFGCKTPNTKDQVLPEILPKLKFLVISPNQDGIQDEEVIDITLKTSNYISYWEMQILNEKKELIKKKTSGGNIEELKKQLFLKKENVDFPKQITWDGKDINGQLQPDGKYFIKFIVLDNNKAVFDTEKIKLDYLYIDNGLPSAKYSIDNKIFSPNGDGNKDELKIKLSIKLDPMEIKYDELKGKDWNIDIMNNQEEVVKRIVYNDSAGVEKELIWNGTDNAGNKLKDGTYSLRINTKNKAGNYWKSEKETVVIDTQSNPISVSVSEGSFSPNSDGIKDTIKFTITAKNKEKIDSWKLSILSMTNSAEAFSFSGKTTLPDSLIWDGKDKKIRNFG